MSFNSLPYLIFIICVCVLHYIFKPKYRNAILLAASYFFYMYIDPRYAVFLLFSTAASYAFARIMEQDDEKRRKFWLIIGIVISLGLLFAVKYLSFLNESISSLLSVFHLSALPRINLIIPIGISFYSFTVTGYLIDVYRKKNQAERNFIDYALFVSFFPQLLSGPIERASNMLVQYKAPRAFNFDNLKAGLLRFLWGLFKKMVIADQLAIIVNSAYSSLAERSSLYILIAVVAYSLQIYVDFSAYSDMAIGSARLLGLNLMDNFDSPYLSSSVKGFWRRWHISLTSWFKDYLYIPLGGSRCSKSRHLLNIFIVFAVSGLWHGASLTFLIWGILNGMYLIIGQLLHPINNKLTRLLKIGEKNKIFNFLKGIFTFVLITFSWIFFRSEDMNQAILVIRSLFTNGGTNITLNLLKIDAYSMVTLGVSLLVLVLVDVLARKKDLLTVINRKLWLIYGICFVLIAVTILFGVYGPGYDPLDFVYFKF